jgi:hypothetical protein
MTQSSVRQEQIRQHRRETLLYVIVPLLVSVFIVLLGIVAVLLLQRQLQVDVLANWMAIVLVFCPAMLCTTVACILLFTGIFLMNRANRAAVKPLEKMNELAETAADRTARAAASINNTTVNVASRFAFLDRLLSTFDLPADNKDMEEK